LNVPIWRFIAAAFDAASSITASDAFRFASSSSDERLASASLFLAYTVGSEHGG
jgi:hypothetical protein